jgi:Holliday junction resolvasome RuvABC endonuclease subunit
MAKICSIDASTNSLAYAIFDDMDLKRYGKIEFSGKTIYEKISEINNLITAEFRNEPIDVAIMERAVFMNSPKTMSELSMVQGAIMAGLSAVSIPKCLGVPPITWQTGIGNKALSKKEKLDIRESHPGKSESWYKTHEREIRKQRTIRFVDINYDVKTSDNDIADAIGIGHYILNNK